MRTTNATEVATARTRLLELCPPDTTIYTVLEHVSRSGMVRYIKPYVIHDGELVWIGGYVETLLANGRSEFARPTTPTRNGGRDGLKVSGCGMDMGFHLVYCLSHTLYPDVDRGGYVLKQRWQ